MNKDELIETLRNFRCYEYSAFNCGESKEEMLPKVYSERMRRPGKWDGPRYSRLVGIVKGAIDYCLDDDQRAVIMRKYLERNKLNINEIATVLHKDRTTIGRWHTEALNILTEALVEVDMKDYEITNYDHFFDKDWQYIPQESA